MSRILAGPFLHTIWRPKVTGAGHVPASGGAILAANHQSVADSVFLPLMMDRPVTFSAKAEYFTASGPAARLWAAYLKATNQLQMDRDGPPRSRGWRPTGTPPPRRPATCTPPPPTPSSPPPPPPTASASSPAASPPRARGRPPKP